MGTKDMPSLNWSRLRPIAHSIASTIRHAQASAYQFHRDLETIREENRRYAAAHYGTAPHWDGYGPDGRRTGNGSGSGNGNRSRSGSRSGSRNGNSDRQRQRDRSFERSHPWMSRALYYAMPHLGGYETGRGFTWNAQGERWGDSLVPVPDAPTLSVPPYRKAGSPTARIWEPRLTRFRPSRSVPPPRLSRRGTGRNPSGTA